MERQEPSGSLGYVLGKLRKVKRQGGGYVAQCPAHEDTSPSLSVAEGKIGVVLHCWAGCNTDAIRQAAGLEWSDLFFEDRQNGHEKPQNGRRSVENPDRRGMAIEARMAAQRLQGDTEVLGRLRDQRGWAAPALEKLGVGWDGERLTLLVHDAAGKEHDVLRYDPFAPGKFKMLAGKGKSRLPWPAPEKLEASAGWPLLIVEGEGTVISLASIGVNAIALPGAVSRPTGDVRNPSRFRGGGWHPAWAKRLAPFRKLACLPDCDESGRTLMTTVYYDLERQGKRVIYLDLQLPAGNDVGDVLRFARNGQSRRVAKDLLRTCLDCADRQPGMLPDALGLLHHWSDSVKRV